MPYLNPWQSVERHPRVKLRSRRIHRSKEGLIATFPNVARINNAPVFFSEMRPEGAKSNIVFRYYRQSRQRLILREAGGDLLRPAVTYRRHRYEFTM